ncbi:hypothetical protein Hanom_Chr08g00686981 [Helianthus anomalus]
MNLECSAASAGLYARRKSLSASSVYPMCCLGLKYSWFFGRRLKTDEPSSSSQVGSCGSVSSHSWFILRGVSRL